MFDLFNLHPEAFGLDISDLSLKIIKLKKKRGVLSLASFGETPIEPGLIEKGELKNEILVAEIVKKALEETRGEKLKTKYVVVSLPEEKSFLEVIQMPKIMEEEKLKKAVYFEAENYVPLPIEQVYLDSQIILPFPNHKNYHDVLIAAMAKNIVDSYVSLLKKAGLLPRVLEIESLAIVRALVEKGESLNPLLLIDFGATKTSFIIFAGRSLKFTSSFPVSSQELTETISKTLGINLSKAESLKLEYGIQNNPRKKGCEVFKAMRPVLNELVEQIRKHLVYYQSHYNHQQQRDKNLEKEVSKILLCGGGARLKGLAAFLRDQLKIPVEIGNPWANIPPEPLQLKEKNSIYKKEQSLNYTTAIGLALRGISGND